MRLAASGETVLVTDRDRVVAELVPPQAGRSQRLEDAVLAQAYREGWLKPPLNRSAPLPPPRPVEPMSVLLDDLAKDREDR